MGMGPSPKKAAHNMLQQADRLLLDELRHHVAEHGADGVEALVRVADVGEAHVVEQDLLHDEDRDRLAQLRARLHDAQTQRDDLGREQEVDHLGRIVLDERADDAERGEAQVFERAGLGGGVEEGIEEERNVRCSSRDKRQPSTPVTAAENSTPAWESFSGDRPLHVPARKRPRVSLCDATHCKSAKALHTRFEAAAVS